MAVSAACVAATAFAASTASAGGSPVAGPAGTLLGDAQASALATLDDRWAAYVDPGNTLHVLDERGPSGGFTIPLPAEDCGHRDRHLTPGVGELVVSCGGPQWRLDMTRRTWSELPHVEAPADVHTAFSGEPSAIGSRWIAYTPWAGGFFYVDRATGARRNDTGAATDVVDLSDPALLRPMCAPLRRPLPERIDSRDPFGRTWYDGETALAVNWFFLTVQRCGERRPTEIGFGSEESSPQLSGGKVTWQTGMPGQVVAYLPDCRLRLRWSAPAAKQVAHTDSAVYFTQAPDGGRATVHRIELPDACSAQPGIRVAGSGPTVRLAAAGWTAPRWDGALVDRLVVPGAAPIRLRPARGRLTVRTPGPVRRVAWTLGEQTVATPATAIGHSRRVWRVVLPRRVRRQTLTLTVRDMPPGGTAGYRIMLGR
jgi:uncharacterized protein YndB with AHSA1/START domain